MTALKDFENRTDADAFLDALGGYDNPAEVAPLKGEAAHEVAVGPVHAGVIEPGHFRFQCVGEDVYNLQIFLGYQHRGVEDEIVKAAGNLPRQIALAETCAGDTSVAAATAFAEIIEAAFGPEGRLPSPSEEDRRLRALLLELERIANHVGDLGALAGDVAFLPTASFCGRLRGEYLNMTALLCGNRFGRGAIVPGGLRITLTGEKRAQLKAWIARTRKDLDGALKLMFEEPTVLERLEGTGVVTRETAEAIGLVGVARRASVDFKGDVFSRALVRKLEIAEAHGKILSILEAEETPAEHAGEKVGEPPAAHGATPRFRTIVATVNAWRGPLVHAALFTAEGRMLRYRIVDPSAHNWPGLAYALRGEQISNFPICNKSFNLSYCGTDR